MNNSPRLILRTTSMLGVAVASLTLLTVPAHAQGSAIFACVNNANGGLRQVSSPSECKINETAVQWSVVGVQGPTGPQGIQGVPGSVGPTGPQGEKGDQGSQGAAGPTGAQGAEGPQGAVGPTGADGPAGTGFSWRGEYDNFAHYSPNDVVLFEGTAWIAIAPIVSPKDFPGGSAHWQKFAQAGADGAQGPQGPQGAQGETGAAGAAGADGPTGTGFNWRGAYSQKQKREYVANDVVSFEGSAWIAVAPIVPPTSIPGTSADWQLFAHGGVDGAEGPQGPQGPQGAQGVQGPTGPSVRGFQEYLDPQVGPDTFVVPDGVTQIQVEIWGAGGGGAAATSSGSGGGGGGGAYHRAVIPVTPGEVFATLVGWEDLCGSYGNFYQTFIYRFADDTFLVANGGSPGLSWGAGGAGGSCDIVPGVPTDVSGYTSYLCRPGGRGADGDGTLGIAVSGGRTPSGTVSLPYGDGGGAGGAACGNGNRGYIFISW